MSNENESTDQIFKELFTEYSDDVFKYAYYLVGNHDDAKDIVQDVFLKVYRNINKFRREAEFKTWIFQITKNQIRDYYRRSYVRKRVKSNKSLIEMKYNDFHSDIETLDALSQLNETKRQVLILRFIEDLSVREVANILRCSESKVRTTQYRALKYLKEILESKNEKEMNLKGDE